MSNEIEPNNSIVFANPVNLGSSIIGALSSNGDVDYYKVSTTTGGLLAIALDRSDAKTDGYDVYIYDNANNLQGSAYFYADSTFLIPVSSAGDYYLKVYRHSFNSWSSDPYTITPTLNYTVGTAYDGESTDKLAQAVVGTLGKPIIGSLNSNGDVDYYKISTTTGGVLDITLDRSDAKTDGYDLFIYDNANNLQGSFYFDTDGTAHVPVSSAGDYYLKVYRLSFNSWSSDPYTITPTLNYRVGTAYDGESTDKLAQAVVGTLGKQIIGASNDNFDVDYYKITTATGGVLDIAFDRSEAKTDGYDLSVYDGANNLQASFYVAADRTAHVPVSSAGDYYIKVEVHSQYGSWSSDLYTMTPTLNYTAGTAYDGESTDKLAQAVMATLGKPIVGALKSNNDVDYYKITTNTAGVLNIALDMSDAKTDGYYLYVYDSFNKLQGSASFQNDGTAKIPVANAGDYYIKLQASSPYGSWTYDLYTLTALVLPPDIVGTSKNDTLTGSNTNDVIKGMGGNDKLQGLSGDDDLQGGDGNDILDGGVGNDILNGSAGADKMTGGAGDDIYVVDNAKDVVTEGKNGGNDELVSFINFVLPNNVETLVLAGGSAANNGTGNALDNEITGNANANKLDGGAGNDHIFGYTGNDTLIGGAGNDLLYGQTGNDTLDGGTGTDVFWFSAGAGQDIIKSFGDKAGNQDIIDLSDFNIGFADLHIAASGKNTLITVNGVNAADFQVSLLGVNVNTLGADDFNF